MRKVRLMVLTVPVIDPITYREHTTFCVSRQSSGQIQYAPGWTLRDAIETYCKWYKVDRDQDIVIYSKEMVDGVTYYVEEARQGRRELAASTM